MLLLVCWLAVLACCSAAFCSSNASKIESLYIVDQLNYRLRVVSPLDVNISTLVGNSVSAVIDGYGTSASFKAALNSGLSRDGKILYVTDGPCIRSVRLDDGFYAVNTVVGNCSISGSVPGGVSVARLGAVLKVAADVGDKGLYIADKNNGRINYFDFQSKTLSYIIGLSSAKLTLNFYQPNALYVSNNADYVLFGQPNVMYIANLTSLWVGSFAGAAPGGTIDGVGTLAKFSGITSIVTYDETKFYVADAFRLVRVVTFPGAVVTTIPIPFNTDFTSFMTLSMNGLFLYSVVGALGWDYYHKIDIVNQVYSRSGNVPDGFSAGYVDGKISTGTVKFRKPTSCIIGNVYNFSTCSKCGVGEYQNVSIRTSLVCLECLKGTYGSSVDSSVCTSCALGKYSSVVGASVCQNCATGSYTSYTAATVCDACAVGKYSISTVGDSEYVCQSCLFGYYSSASQASTCQQCSAGTYVSYQGASACQQCSAGSFSSGMGAFNCYKCFVGYYSPNAGSTACEPCKSGTFNAITGVSVCQDCPLGSYNGFLYASSCSFCSSGTYASSVSSSVCLGCPSGTFASGSASSSCSLCLAGAYCGVNSVMGTNCTAGSYNTATGSNSLFTNTTGSNNTAIGYASLYLNNQDELQLE